MRSIDYDTSAAHISAYVYNEKTDVKIQCGSSSSNLNIFGWARGGMGFPMGVHAILANVCVNVNVLCARSVAAGKTTMLAA